MGCLGGVPIGIALTGGLPITGEDALGGGTLSDKSSPSSLLIGGVRFGSSFIMDNSGESCKGEKKRICM